MARAIEHFLTQDPDLAGVWHLAAARIDKYTLLTKLLERLRPRDVEIVPDDGFSCERSLDASRLEVRTTYRVATWDAMLDELADAIRRRERET